jgi:hypothetical protein
MACVTKEKEQQNTSTKEKPGILIGNILFEFENENLKDVIKSNVKNIEITYLDWYPNKEITVSANSNGFYYFPIERNSIFWLRRVEITFNVGTDLYSLTLNLTSFQSKYALHAAFYMDNVNNAGIVKFKVDQNNNFEIEYNYGYNNVLENAFNIAEMKKYYGYRLNNAKLGNG